MKITIELDNAVVKALLGLAVAVGCVWEGRPEMAAAAAAMIAALKT